MAQKMKIKFSLNVDVDVDHYRKANPTEPTGSLEELKEVYNQIGRNYRDTCPEGVTCTWNVEGTETNEA